MQTLHSTVLSFAFTFLTACGTTVIETAPAPSAPAPGGEDPAAPSVGDPGATPPGTAPPKVPGGTAIWEQRLDLTNGGQRAMTDLVALSTGVTVAGALDAIASGRMAGGNPIPQPDLTFIPATGGAPKTTLVDAWYVVSPRVVDDAVAYVGVSRDVTPSAYYEEVPANGAKRKRRVLPPGAADETRLLAQGRYAGVKTDYAQNWDVTRYSASGAVERTERFQSKYTQSKGSLYASAMSDAGAIALGGIDGSNEVDLVPVSGPAVSVTLPYDISVVAFSGTFLIAATSTGVAQVLDEHGTLVSACTSQHIFPLALGRATNGDVFLAGYMSGSVHYSRAVVRRVDAKTGATIWEHAVDETTIGGESFARYLTQAPDGALYAGIEVQKKEGTPSAAVIVRISP